MSDMIEEMSALEAAMQDWSDRQIIGWLRAGFAQADEDDPTLIRDAFRPLSLSPQVETSSQLGSALVEAEQRGFECTNRLRTALLELLASADVLDEDPLFLRHLWELLAAIGCRAIVSATARNFIENMLAGPRSPYQADIAAAVATTVAASQPMTSSQLTFLDFLHEKVQLWRPELVSLVIDCEFEKAARRQSIGYDEGLAPVWRRVRTRFLDDLCEETDPDTPAGRALVRSIAADLGVMDRDGGHDDLSIVRDSLLREPAPAPASADTGYLVFKEPDPMPALLALSGGY